MSKITGERMFFEHELIYKCRPLFNKSEAAIQSWGQLFITVLSEFNNNQTEIIIDPSSPLINITAAGMKQCKPFQVFSGHLCCWVH
jgi:hypothetical protein